MSAEATAEVTTTKEVEKSDKQEAEAEAKPEAKEEETTKSPRKEEEKQETKEKENENPKSPQPKENGEPEGAAAATKLPTLREQFKAFSKFGDTKSDGKHLTLSQSDKWMKQAKVIDGKTITTTDTAIHFKKFKQMKITFPDYEKYLGELAKSKTMEVATLKNKLRSSGAPGTSGTTAVLKNEAVDRLTDSKKYTGSHKIRVEKGKSTPSPKK